MATSGAFRFSVKVPKTITHAPVLRCADEFDVFIASARCLGDKLGPLLVQFPPSRSFKLREAQNFFDQVQRRFDGDVICEPRHSTWFTSKGNDLLKKHHVARVAALKIPTWVIFDNTALGAAPINALELQSML